jgi:hypothetical protein
MRLVAKTDELGGNAINKALRRLNSILHVGFHAYNLDRPLRPIDRRAGEYSDLNTVFEWFGLKEVARSLSIIDPLHGQEHALQGSYRSFDQECGAPRVRDNAM